MAAGTSTVSPARQVAAAVLRRVEDEGAYADRALAGEAARAGLEGREHAFATALTYGVVQRKRTLDHVIATLARRPVSQLDPAVRDALRLGVLQLLFLDGVAPHAAVDQSVELAKAAGGPGFKLVNAVLRRAGREGPRILEHLDDATPQGAAELHSTPTWLAKLWWDALGADDARALLERINAPAEASMRVNTLVASPEQVARELGERGVEVRPAPDLPEGLVLDSPLDLRNDPLFASGALLAQSRAAMSAARLLDPQPGMRVLDLCAAPGGKATHLAALMEGSGEVVAVEQHPGRATALADAARRLHADIVRVDQADASMPRTDGPFDAVLVDPPCSGLGTLQGRPDLRWRASKDAIAHLRGLQGRILTAGAEALAPGGALVYATCTISPTENEDVVARFLADPAHAAFRLVSQRQLLPHRDGTDGFFLARIERAG